MTTLNHKFVECIPDFLDEKVIYISIAHSTVVHLCCCGCGREVVTPLAPTDWKLIFDGDSVSLRPSIGNWRFPCRSHYWIKQNRVEWAESWPEWRVEAGDETDRGRKADYYNRPEEADTSSEDKHTRRGFWRSLWSRW